MAKLHFGSKEYFEKQSEFWFKENSKHISERDAYKKQRDELINDMQNVKRKAEAFDGISEVLESISKDILDNPGDYDAQKEIIYRRWDELFEPFKLLEEQ